MFLLNLILFICFQSICLSSEKEVCFYPWPVDKGLYVPYEETPYLHTQHQKHFDGLTEDSAITKLTVIGEGGSLPLDFTTLTRAHHLQTLEFTAKDGQTFNPDFILQIPYVPSLVQMRISDARFTEDPTKIIPSLIDSNPQIESLDLSGTYLLDKDNLFLFTNLQNLKKLSLRNWNHRIVFSEGQHIPTLYQFPLLRSLDVRNNPYLARGDALSLILQLPQLEELLLGGDPYTEIMFLEEEKFHLSTTSKRLKSLTLEHAFMYSVDFSYVAPNLTHLSLKDVSGFFDWRQLQAHQQLQELHLFDIEWDVSAIEQIESISLSKVERLQSNSLKDIDLSVLAPNVKELYLENSKIKNAALEKIGQIHSLEILDISRTAVRDNFLVYLQNLKRLQKLSLEEVTVNKSDFAILKNLPSLRELSLSGTHISLSQLEDLVELSFLDRLDLSNMLNRNITAENIQKLREKMAETTIISDLEMNF